MTLSSSPGESKVQTAGRELDAEIAERVMGWVWFVDSRGAGERWLSTTGYIENADSRDFMRRAAGTEPVLDIQVTPHYSTSIADAWLVVEKIQRERRYGFVLRSWSAELQSAEFSFPNDPGWLVAQAESPAAPLAICLAALRALENAPSSSVPSTGGEL